MNTDSEIRAGYAGQRMPLFLLTLKTGILTILTLGIYRFWAKTRIRRYVWSSAIIDGDSFEYTGTGLEKFLGFLLAVVILAVYLATIELALYFLDLRFFIVQAEPGAFPIFASTVISILTILPLIFFAQYRARRYRLTRTRWRGLRFGMEHGAWGYAFRALGHWILTLITLGLLLPRQTFWLEKYLTDRSWFGNAQFEQEGEWIDLYPAMKHLIIGVAVLIGGLAVSFGVTPVLGAILMIIGGVWIFVGIVSYRIRSFVYLTQSKTLHGQFIFTADTSTSTVVERLLTGIFFTGILGGVIFFVVGAFIALAIGIISNQVGTPSLSNPGVAGILMFVIPYIAAYAAGYALALVWITQPVIEHFVQSVSIRDPATLDDIRQRSAERGADAEGFADALDVGGGI